MNRTNKKIEELERKFYELRSNIKSLQFVVENPPKFKKADRVKNYMITSRFATPYCWKYEVINLDTAEKLFMNETKLLCLVDSNTGQK